MQNYISSKIGNFFNSNTQSMDSREQLRIIISRFTSFITRNLFKKKERERPSIKIPWTFFDSTYTRRTPLVPFNLVGKEARNRFEGDAKGFAMAQKFLSDIDFAEDPPRPLPVWRVSPSEIRDSIKPHPPDRGKKRARDRGRLWIGVNETNWPKKRARKHPKLSPMTRYAKPEFGIQPPLYLPLSSSPSSPLSPSPPLLPGSTIAPRFSSRVEGRVHLLPIQLRTYMWPMCPVCFTIITDFAFDR